MNKRRGLAGATNYIQNKVFLLDDDEIAITVTRQQFEILRTLKPYYGDLIKALNAAGFTTIEHRKEHLADIISVVIESIKQRRISNETFH
jgi:hypothetical protein